MSYRTIPLSVPATFINNLVLVGGQWSPLRFCHFLLEESATDMHRIEEVGVLQRRQNLAAKMKIPVLVIVLTEHSRLLSSSCE
jgi:hypothetical protein